MLCTPLYPMVLLIIIPFLNGYFIGNINPTFSGPNPYACFRLLYVLSQRASSTRRRLAMLSDVDGAFLHHHWRHPKRLNENMDPFDKNGSFLGYSPIFGTHTAYDCYSSPWYRWPIEIDGLPIKLLMTVTLRHGYYDGPNRNRWFTVLKNGWIFHGSVTNNQMGTQNIITSCFLFPLRPHEKTKTYLVLRKKQLDRQHFSHQVG